MEETSSTSIIETINEIFSNIFSSVDNSIYEILDEITFIDSSITENSSFEKLFGSSSSEGILLVCNALILGIIIFYATNYLFSHLTYSKIQRPSQFIFKCVIFIGIMNESLWICSQIINIVSLISSSIQSIGESILDEEITFMNFIEKINDTVYSSDSELSITSFEGIIKSITTMGFMSLIFSYALRYIMLQVFVLISPFCFLCLINDRTEWIFKSWIKAFISLLVEQILIAIILLLAFSIELTSNDTMSQLIYIGIIYALMKTNSYMYMLFGGITTSISTGNMMLKNTRNIINLYF